jgi:ADP-heptose:LPS heptosyltransferase
VKPHVLVVRLDNEGDVLLAGPAVRAVAAGAARVTFLCGRRGRAAAHLLPGVDEVVEFTAPWIDPEPEPVTRAELELLVSQVRERGVDVAVILTSFHQSPLPTALALRLAGVPRIAAVSDDYPGSLLDFRHLVDPDIHEVERGVSLAEAAGFPLPAEDDMRLAIKPVPVPVHEEPYVVVHPGASVPARAWSPRRCRELVAALCARGYRVRVTGGRAERELTAFVAGSTGALDLGGRTDLPGLASTLAGASVLVCGNTGPAHLAAAVGTPVVSIFAPTVPASRWRPWGVPHVLLGDQEIECAGCRSRVCPYAGQPCLAGVRVLHVVEAVEQLAARTNGDVWGSRKGAIRISTMYREGAS